MKKVFVIILFLAAGLFFAYNAVAKTDLSISESDITFSKDQPLVGDLIKIFARINNSGDDNVYGSVLFLDNGNQISESQPISVKVNTYDDAFIDWRASAGNHNIEAKIIGINPQDENSGNNSAIKKNFFVDLDTDKDGVGDTKDSDVDNDGLSNDEENKSGTDPLKIDTDGDGVNDKVDAFPKDATEFRDTDNDGLGDNKDLDDDGDGIFDQDEIFEYGTNPLSADTDNDGVADGKEIENYTNPIKPDTDGDEVIDSQDAFPLDSSKWQAGFMSSVFSFFKGKEYLYFVLAVPALLVLYLLFRRKKRRR